MINLILFGPPGSGKGTQAAYLVDKYQLLHISTGDLFRYEMGNNTRLGMEAKRYIEKGELVPDEVTIGMLRNKVEMHPEAAGFIFDGFPRTVAQAEALDALLAESDQEVNALLALEVEFRKGQPGDIEQAIERLEQQIRATYPEVKRIFIEARSSGAKS